MFKELKKTAYPPDNKPLMVWDGNCGFCHYWVIRWQKLTDNTIEYEKFQKVSNKFKDIPEERFAEAVRLIETDGKIYNGPEAAYRSFTYTKSFWSFLYRFYKESKIFRGISNICYQWIADHRSFMYKVSVFLWGKNPASPKPFWAIYLLVLTGIIFVACWWLTKP